jgi:hypothetical protein
MNAKAGKQGREGKMPIRERGSSAPRMKYDKMPE